MGQELGTELARYVIEAVIRRGRSCREVAAAHGVSKSWVAKVVARYRAGGTEAIGPRSRAARRFPNRTPSELEEAIVALRKRLVDDGLDAGAVTIHYHLQRSGGPVPSVPTIWRVLRRRGFVTPQPHKRPRSSWKRFEAAMPNECWQSDATHWRLAEDTDVEIVNVIDDHSRVCIASRAVPVTTAADLVRILRSAGETWGFPASVLSDNGNAYTTWHRGGPNAFQAELLARGIRFVNSRPYHPQTCGKVERFHQTLKLFLAKQDPPGSIVELQAQIDRFVAYYNDVRPHRAKGRTTPRAAFDARDKARPTGIAIKIGEGVRVRRDRIDRNGKVTLRYRTRLHHIGVGKAHKGKRVIMLIDDLEIRVLDEDGEVLRELVLDPSKDYQGTGRPPGPPKGRPRGPRRG
jgi:transposase InsO family protein